MGLTGILHGIRAQELTQPIENRKTFTNILQPVSEKFLLQRIFSLKLGPKWPCWDWEFGTLFFDFLKVV